MPADEVGKVMAISFTPSPTTRTAVMDGINMKDFRAFANLPDNGEETTALPYKGAEGFNYFENLIVMKETSGEWKPYPLVYWPNSRSKVSFYAYSPAASVNVCSIGSNMLESAATSNDYAVLEYDVPAKAVGGKQPEDFLVSEIKQSAEEGTTVSLLFYHALSMASFYGRHRVNTDSITIIIDSLQMINIAHKGMLKIDDFSVPNVYWEPDYTDLVTYRFGLPGSGVPLVPSVFDDGGNEFRSLTSDTEAVPILPQVVETGKSDESKAGIKIWYHAYSNEKAWGSADAPIPHIFSFPPTFDAGVTAGNPTNPAHGDFVFQLGRYYCFYIDFDVTTEGVLRADMSVGE
jgi:hypothetical protein